MTFCWTREDFRSDVSPPHCQKHTFLHLFNAADIIIIIIRFFCLKTKRLGRRKSSWETLGDDLWYFEDPVSGRFTQKRPEVNSNIKKTTLKKTLNVQIYSRRYNSMFNTNEGQRSHLLTHTHIPAHKRR